MPHVDPDARRAYAAGWARRHNRSLAGRGTCVTCGGPMGTGSGAQGCSECRACWLAKAERYRQEIVRLWALGASYEEIARATGKTRGSVALQMHRMRRGGYDLPFRN